MIIRFMVIGIISNRSQKNKRSVFVYEEKYKSNNMIIKTWMRSALE